MRRWSPRGAVLRLGLLFAALVLMAPARAVRPANFRPVPGMPGGRRMPSPTGTATNLPSFRTPGTSASLTGPGSMPFSLPGYGRSSPASMQGRYGSGASGGSPGGGYSGGGGGPTGAGSATTGAAAAPNPYADLYDRSAAEQGPPPSAGAGPLVGLLNAGGGLDWPLALRILPPGLEARDLRARLDARAGEVARQAAAGPVAPDLLRQANRDVDRLAALLQDRGDALPVSQQATTDARLFLRRLRDALKPVP